MVAGLVYNTRLLEKLGVERSRMIVFERRYADLVASRRGQIVIYYAATTRAHVARRYVAIGRTGELFALPSHPSLLAANISGYVPFETPVHNVMG